MSPDETVTKRTPLSEQERATAREIAKQLHEPHAYIIYRIVGIAGSEQSLLWLAETLAQEQQGGVLTAKGQRRTPGGAFIRRARDNHADVEAFCSAYNFSRSPTRDQLSTPVERPAPKPPVTWEDRLELIPELLKKKLGEASVKITLIGKPEKVLQKGTFVVAGFRSKVAPALPKGLPRPPDDDKTVYVAYIAQKQWSAVAAAANDPEDKLVIEGWSRLDTETKTIAVYVSRVFSVKQQQAERAKQKAQAEAAKQGK